MKSKIMTYVIVGGLIGYLTDGLFIGITAFVLIYIAFQLEEIVQLLKKRTDDAA